MQLSRFTLVMSALIFVFGAHSASAQNFPTRPIRIITSGPGGNTDFASRLIAAAISGPLGQPVIVENRPAIIGAEIVAKALPDGYTLLYGGGTLWIGALLDQTPYSATKDFSPVTWATSTPNLVVVTASLPVNNVKDLIALAKSKPGGLSYASTAAGSGPYLAAELFKAMTGVSMVRVLYKGTPPALSDLASGQVQLTFPVAEAVSAFIKSGKLRALAVTSAQPTPLMPGLPTVAASGVPGYEFTATFGAFVPAKTPRAVIDRLNAEIARAITTADAKEKFFNSGAEVIAAPPERFAALIKADVAKWSKLIKQLDIKKDS